MAFLPPDEHHLDLAREINRTLGKTAKVSFFRLAAADGQTHYGVIFEHEASRKSQQSEVPYFDPDGIVDDVQAWLRELEMRRQAQRWTTTPPEDQPWE